MRAAVSLFLLFALCTVNAQFFDIAMVRANDSNVSSLVYDINSTSYKDNSLSNPDLNLRICASAPGELLGRYYALAYADAFDGDYLLVTHAPVQITSVPPNNCPELPLEISSFRAWYPSIPYVFISDSMDMSNASRWKLSRLRGWFMGSYIVNETQLGSLVNITVTNARDENNASIVPDVDYLVIGIVRPDYTAMDTAISSPNNTVELAADSPTANYTIFINGIGPDLPPYVEILTPEPITYDTGTIPFTYIMIDDDAIASCWYVLDGTNYPMPACDVAYILNVGDGPHTLTLFGQDTTGNIGSDSVTFTVGAPGPPPTPGGGGGIPYIPTVPSPPPDVLLSIKEPDITVVIDYPENGSADFLLESTADLSNVHCFIRGDFAEYSRVEVASEVTAGQGIRGTIYVEMEPLEILDYDGSKAGSMQCTGQYNPSLSASTIANVYLVINLPRLVLENKTVEYVSGQRGDEFLLLNLTGDGQASTIGTTVEIMRHQSFVFLSGYPEAIDAHDYGFVNLVIDAWGLEEGTYRVPIEVYEFGRFMTRGYLTINVLKYPPEAGICMVYDMRWTIIIPMLGLLNSMFLYYRKLKDVALAAGRFRKTLHNRAVFWWGRNRKPLSYSFGNMLLFVLIWAIVLWLISACI